MPAAYQPVISRAAASTGVFAPVIIAAFGLESGFNKDATGPVTHTGERAGGIGQLMPDTARGLGLRVDGRVDERYNPAKAIPAATRYLKEGVDQARDMGVQSPAEQHAMALAGYHAGHGTIAKIIQRVGPTWRAVEARLRQLKIGDGNMLTADYVRSIGGKAGLFR